MPKAERGTPKDLANRMKAKGLQKLRWYCQMCQKQCRDMNGFKCHTSSESHQRQLLLFAENPNRYLDQFSKEFSDGYVELLRRQFGTKRVHANQVYQEYIADRHHLHMNATKWLTLTDFVQWLGREHICIVDETEKGWYVTWIDRDPDTILAQQQEAKKKKLDKDDQARMDEFVRKQAEKNKDKCEESVYTELKRNPEDEKLKLSLNSSSSSKPSMNVVTKNVLSDSPKSDWYKSDSKKCSASSSKRPISALEQIKREEERRKQKHFKENDGWLHEGIVVKVITKLLGEDYYKKKGVVVSTSGKYTAIVKLLDTGTKIKLDQEHMETVIPREGREVLILKGRYQGKIATLISIDVDKLSATLRINLGQKEQVVSQTRFEDFSKLYQSS